MLRRRSGWLGAIDAPLQRAAAASTGLNGMAAFFLAPNMLIFGDLRPVAAHHQFRLLDDRRDGALPGETAPLSAPSSIERLFDCGNYLDPTTLPRGSVLDRRPQHRRSSSFCRSR